MEYSQVTMNDIESATQERRKREEKECEKKCHLCICYALLGFACIMIDQAIVAGIVFTPYFYSPDVFFSLFTPITFFISTTIKHIY